jgi:hypothetical protein
MLCEEKGCQHHLSQEEKYRVGEIPYSSKGFADLSDSWKIG